MSKQPSVMAHMWVVSVEHFQVSGHDETVLLGVFITWEMARDAVEREVEKVVFWEKLAAGLWKWAMGKNKRGHSICYVERMPVNALESEAELISRFSSQK